jgi:hypothetical protein
MPLTRSAFAEMLLSTYCLSDAWFGALGDPGNVKGPVIVSPAFET